MELYCSPMACSLASHITALEAGLPVRINFVNTAARQTDSGDDFLQISPNGYVPALRIDSGDILNEGPSVLQYLADRKPEKNLAPKWGTLERYQLIDVLNYISTEMHKALFIPLLTPGAPQPAKAEAEAELPRALDYIQGRLGDKKYLLGENFTVADAYLFVMLTWAAYVGTDMKRYPHLAAYYQRIMARPTVAKAFGEEMDLFRKRAA